MFRKTIPCYAVIGFLICVGRASAADPLNLELLDSPDFISGFLDVSYDSINDLFEVDGFALEFDEDGIGVPFGIDNGTFELDAMIDSLGMLSGGSVQIGGTIPGLGLNSGTLLTGNIVDFGFEADAGAPLEFLVSLTGGDAASYYQSDPVGLILTQSGFTGTFESDFDNLMGGSSGTGSGLADVAPVVPLPESGLLALVGAALACWTRRRTASS